MNHSKYHREGKCFHGYLIIKILLGRREIVKSGSRETGISSAHLVLVFAPALSTLILVVIESRSFWLVDKRLTTGGEGKKDYIFIVIFTPCGSPII